MRLSFPVYIPQRLRSLVQGAPETTPPRRFVSGAPVATVVWALLLVFVLVTGCRGRVGPPGDDLSTLPGVSGLAWAGPDSFIAVHDAKHPAEPSVPRISLIRRSGSNGQPTWRPLDVRWPSAEGPSSDLESIARIPGTPQFLLVESGAGRKPVPHIYLAERHGDKLSIQAAVPWPTTPHNVEGSAVVRVGNALVFVYAERSEHEAAGTLGWSPLSTETLRRGGLQWGPVEHVSLRRPDWVPPDTRLVSAVAITREGRIYVSSAHDPGGDEGPFQSHIWTVGRLIGDSTGTPVLQHASQPCRLATLDGFKTEGLALAPDRRSPGVFIGTDDEQFGGAFRPLPIRLSCSQ